ncbi:hypothetical protein [Flavobacterium sp. DG2-3]|uniref:hypothetical protein n=1 Tax=Flavobacterium sp. DG2-3 TaxID=3068317 RepID=UPI00273F0D2E|nr:hypothetical protein [Flavobacterium sp. DG2-3]MDP5202029.1 hypothetical protein [Flavobacterium sp. DG2-3]
MTTFLFFFFTVFSVGQQIADGFASGLSINDFNQPLKSGVYEVNSLSIIPDISYSWQHVFVMRHSNYSNNFQLQFSSSFNQNDRVFFRKIANSPDSPWIELATRAQNTFSGNQIINGNIGIGTNAPETLLNVNVGSGGSNGIAGIRVGGLNNYSSLELGIDGDYDGMIRSYGNNINYYAGHWKTKGSVASENHSHNWYTSKNGSSDWSNVKMILNENGNLGIGVVNPTSKLDVNGTIHSKEVKVDLNFPAPDYVFKNNYNLRPLQEVENYIKENSHLPEIPSAKELEKNGINVSEMNMALLKKIEELTLYMIEMKKEIERVKSENLKMKKDILRLN